MQIKVGGKKSKKCSISEKNSIKHKSKQYFNLDSKIEFLPVENRVGESLEEGKTK